jgi:hypothetical protein
MCFEFLIAKSLEFIIKVIVGAPELIGIGNIKNGTNGNVLSLFKVGKVSILCDVEAGKELVELCLKMLELEVVHSQRNCCVVRGLAMADVFGIGLFVWFVDEKL